MPKLTQNELLGLIDKCIERWKAIVVTSLAGDDGRPEEVKRLMVLKRHRLRGRLGAATAIRDAITGDPMVLKMMADPNHKMEDVV